jgi:membrane protein YqaA with SNARE-associated domain
MNRARVAWRGAAGLAAQRASWLITISAFLTACVLVGSRPCIAAYVLTGVGAAAVVALIVTEILT